MFRSLKARSMQCSDLACERTFTIQKIEDVSIRDRRGLTRAESVCELGLTVVKNTAALDPSVHRPRVQDAPLDGFNLWPALTNDSAPPRKDIHIR